MGRTPSVQSSHCLVFMRMESKAAESYSKDSSVQTEDGLSLIRLTFIEKGNKVLDIGCGTGYLTNMLASEVGSEGKVGM